MTIKTILTTLFFCLIVSYGISSITYFLLELGQAKNPESDMYRGIFYNNLANTFAAFLSIFLFSAYIEQRIQSNYIKYGVLAALTLLLSLLGGTIIYFLYWKNLTGLVLERPGSQDSSFYAFIPAIVSSVCYYFWQQSNNSSKKIAAQEYQLLNLEKLKTQAELNALQAKINPHFLHNALNSIASLVHSDPDKAEQMTMLLSKLFRHTVGIKEQNFDSLKNELDIVQTYLEIEKVRFGERLNYSVEIEKGLENIEIPRFLLQPIVENAIKHGISKLSEKGFIKTRIYKEKELLKIEVSDNGPDFPENLTTGYGIGSIREKLHLLYGNKATLTLMNKPTKTVSIDIVC